MATGLIALLDDIAAIAKLAAASLDDIAAQTAKAGAKAAGVVIDDAAVTPRYVVGLSPARELAIIAKIALGSLKNKLLYLLPAGLFLGYFAPWAITPLLMIGGVYLCYEGAEKLYEAFVPHDAHDHEAAVSGTSDPAALENQKVSGAIRTDFILSAEIMALTLANVAASNIYTQAAVLASVGILITLAVYGVVALIVKADDVGLSLAGSSLGLLRTVGRGLVVGVPVFLNILAMIGTAAMLWVGGSILVHGMAELGYHGPEHFIEGIAAGIGTVSAYFGEILHWTTTSAIQAALAIVIGGVTIVLVHASAPLIKRLRPQS
jgi:predicted DNA repair protein MutK